MKFCPAILYYIQSTYTIISFTYTNSLLYYNSGSQSPVSHQGGPGSIQGHPCGVYGKESGTGISVSPSNVSPLLSVSLHQCSIFIHLSPTLHILEIVCTVKKPAYQSTQTYTSIHTPSIPTYKVNTNYVFLGFKIYLVYM